ncbi:MAG: hypothetical protein DHS20C17_25020 [Cyclobacteriaceae bacterium]|nr:MAG: hypothetical protein DHS20C17_25020 [Cyclobacteriaceae bacterium]
MNQTNHFHATFHDFRGWKIALNLRWLSIVFFVSLYFVSIRLDANVIEVWVVGDGEKVFKFDADHFAKGNNSIWDGNMVRLKGLYNEVLGFQVIVVLDSLGAEGLEISMAPPVHAKTDRIIGEPGRMAYGDQGGIEYFTQHYLNVTRPTDPQWFYGSENSAPEHMTGWIPDALIPSNAKPGTGGFPVKVLPTESSERRHQNQIEIIERAAKQNQGFWIDLYLPRDRSFSSGIYKSVITVKDNGKVVEEIPLQIELINAYLPDENHSNVWVYSSNFNALSDYFPDSSPGQIEQMLKFEARRHRIDLVGGSVVHSMTFNDDQMNEYKPYLDGSAFSAQHGYYGPGRNVGEKIFPIGMYGNQVLGNTKQTVQSESNKWVDWFDKNAPEVRYFWYIIDEPGPVQFPWIKERTGWLKSNPGPGKKMPVHLTRGYTEELKDNIDIWDEYNGVRLDRQQELWDQGKDYWFYNGNRPRYGSVILEGTAVDLRVNGWIKYLYSIDTWFLWQSTHWTHNGQGPKNSLRQRIFNDPLTFINWGFNFGNGDGILFYPGRMPHQLEEDRGINKVMPSIRLKNIRRGQQDYELLWLVEQKSGPEAAKQLARELVGKAMSEVEMTDKVYWPQHGADYDRMRDKILDILVSDN